MSIFNYTSSLGGVVSSAAVDAVYYDRDSENLAAVLHGVVYVYSNVRELEYWKLTRGSGHSGSIGAAFAEFKKDFGPANNWGSVQNVNFRAEEDPANVLQFPVGTPKGLTYAEGATVTNVGQESHVTTIYNLSSPESPVGNTRGKYRVVFDVVDGKTGVPNTLEADSVEDAVAQTTEIAQMLGLEFKVKEVTVYFE